MQPSTSTQPVPATRDVIVLDQSSLAATRIVMAMHRSGPEDLEDALAVYAWMSHRSHPDPATGLRVYPSGTEAAMWLHGYRAQYDRDLPCLYCD